MEAKHTPGPWHANWTRISGQAIGFHISGPRHGSLRPICEAYDATGATPPEEIEANARLIAAAPELLAALQWIVSQPQGYMYLEVREKAAAALAKATGGAA